MGTVYQLDQDCCANNCQHQDPFQLIQGKGGQKKKNQGNSCYRHK